MIQVEYQTSRGKITKHYSANTFPCEAIIKLVQTGVTVTINSAGNLTKPINSIAVQTKIALDILDNNGDISLPDIIGKLQYK